MAEDNIDSLVKRMGEILEKTGAKVQRGALETGPERIEKDTIIIRIGDYESARTFVHNLKDEVGTRFRDGDYSLKGHEDIKKGAEILGQQLLDQAKKSGIKITDLKEFENADFDKDGTVTAKEVGALLLAADMGATVNCFGEVESEFHNSIRRADMNSLIPPKANEALREIAKQLLQDNGVNVAESKTDAQFVQVMKTNPAVSKQRR